MYIQSVNIGKPQMRPRNGSDVLTGGDKQPVPDAFLHLFGFEGDGQGDPVNHGGPDKAACVYALDHYPYWEGILQRTNTKYVSAISFVPGRHCCR
jgi:MOSC domain-containing protein YiiM